MKKRQFGNPREFSFFFRHNMIIADGDEVRYGGTPQSTGDPSLNHQGS